MNVQTETRIFIFSFCIIFVLYPSGGALHEAIRADNLSPPDFFILMYSVMKTADP